MPCRGNSTALLQAGLFILEPLNTDVPQRMINLANYYKKLNDAKYVVVTCMAITLGIAWLQKPDQQNLAQTLMQRLDFLIYDLRFNAFPLTQTTNNDTQVVIIDIDEHSLKTIGRFPWSRRIIADLVTHLAQANVATVAFDVMFTEPENNIALSVANDIKNKSVRNELRKIASQFDYDQLMADTIAPNDIILGYAFNDEEITTANLPNSTIRLTPELVQQTSIENMAGYTANILNLQTAAKGNGFINGNPDIDGSVRRAPLLLRYGDQLYASLALQTVMNYLLIDSITPDTINQSHVTYMQGITLADNKLIHTDVAGKMLIPYRGPQKTFTYFSAADVLQNKIDGQQLAGKIAIVGTSAVGLKDLRTTPVGVSYPGVEIQATIIDALLQGIAPYKPDWVVAVNIISILVLGFIFCLAMPACGPWIMTIIGLGSATTLSILNIWLWQHHHLDLPASGPLLMIALIYGLNLSYGFFSISHQKTQIKSMFGQYVAPAHIDRLLEDTSSLSFDGETKEMTVLFADIRNFTNTSEKLNANELKDMLNRYLTPMTEVIFEQQGTIDKYVGDLIMAFWGAPLPDTNQKEHAINAALLMLARLKKLCLEFKTLNYPELHIGIGINSGAMNVGDMGSVYRRAYTVLGDAVNLGSRLESITKFYGIPCLVSESTKVGLENKFLFREIDYVQVKGKKEPVRIFEPLVSQHESTPALLATLSVYEKARAAYLNRQWSEATTLYTQLCEADLSSEKLYRLYLERIDIYQTETLSEDWAGIWKHDEK
jgi:adenylate cyclase